MNCPHEDTDEQFELTWCKDCGAVRYPEADDWTQPKAITLLTIAGDLADCEHKSPLRPHGSIYEWCRPCGAIRLAAGASQDDRGPGEWIPSRATRDAQSMLEAMGLR